ncbi:MAG: PilZ domain-containing protein [Candidatus Omnitrophica bacterium]|nr:PilZ domain-containing protein [Candidatus Omnitrophota bacterium]
MMVPREKERRRRKRVDVALPIKIEYNRERLAEATVNISTLGTYFESDNEIPIGTALDMVLEIPKPKMQTAEPVHICCSGVVFRCQLTGNRDSKSRFGIGVFFRSFEEGGEESLSQYLDHVISEEKIKGKIFMQKRQEQKRKGGR